MAEKQSGTFIAFDFGTKHIGVAVGQTVTQTASPLNFLAAEKGIPDWNQISKLIDQWQPIGFVVGVPLNMDNSSQPITHKVRKFITALQQKFLLPVYSVDERLTTVEAKQKLFELGGYKALKTISIDSYAAKLILESWMSSSARGSS